jgi:hypothetical protein
MELETEVTQFVHDYLNAWNSYDVARMRAMWDHGDAFPIYVAEECEPLLGWDAIESYWSIDRSNSVRGLTIRDLIVKPVSADTALAFYHMRWNVYIPGNRLYPNAFGNEVRVSAHLRRREGQWRLFHYIEAPLASLVQLRRMHEAQIPAEFQARVEARRSNAQ